MGQYKFSLFIFFLILISSCIGDDILFDTVEPEARITVAADTIAVGSEFQFKATYFNNIGREDNAVDINWESQHPEIISIDNNGLAKAIKAGSTEISVTVLKGTNAPVSASMIVVAGANTSVQTNDLSGIITSSSSYELGGSFVLKKTAAGNTELSFGSDYVASTALPGLYVYLTNNRNSIASAYEIGRVEVFKGEHKYDLGTSVGLTDYRFVLYYCKPFNVKVGDGEIK